MTKLDRLIPIFFVLLWSTGFVGAKYALPHADPFWFLAIRCVATIIVLGLFIVLLKRRMFFDKRSVHQILIGTLIHGGYLGGVFYAISKGMPAGVTAVIVGIQPLLTAIFSSALGLGQLVRIQIVGLILGFVAICLVIFDLQGLSSTGVSYLGVIAALVALFSISIGTVIQKIIGGDTPFMGATFWQFVGASGFFLALSFALEDQTITWVPSLVAALIWLVCGLSIGAILLLMYMIRKGKMSQVASFFYLVPPVVLIESYFLFDEDIGLVGIFGSALAVFSIYLVNKTTVISK